jgi:hypothetical protein
MIYRGQSFSCGRLLRLHARPTPPPVSKFLIVLSLPVCRRPSLINDGRGGGEWSRIIRPQKSLAIYKSLNPLWVGWSWTYENCGKMSKVKSLCVKFFQKFADRSRS